MVHTIAWKPPVWCRCFHYTCTCSQVCNAARKAQGLGFQLIDIICNRSQVTAGMAWLVWQHYHLTTMLLVLAMLACTSWNEGSLEMSPRKNRGCCWWSWNKMSQIQFRWRVLAKAVIQQVIHLQKVVHFEPSCWVQGRIQGGLGGLYTVKNGVLRGLRNVVYF